ncbi:IclR family transcriptional regulator [Muricoccus radiodurans]|uniref:IclR family transcriptional regulator n=1 Tax=Muricoccus radiodurans TaxID=2231721 RepID=UPI003CEE0E75
MPTAPERPRRGRPPAPGREPSGTADRVEAVERALTLLNAFADGTPRLTLAELAARAGLYPSTALRLAGSLQRFGYLQRDADGLFRLGPAPLLLGGLYQRSFDLSENVRPALARLVARTGETASFFVREGDHRVCLLRTSSPRPIRHHVEEGSLLPLDRGASAHVLMAHTGGEGERLDAVRSRGLAVSVGERDPETAAVAAPVWGRSAFLGALGVTGPRGRFEGAHLSEIEVAVSEEARALTRILGG